MKRTKVFPIYYVGSLITNSHINCHSFKETDYNSF